MKVKSLSIENIGPLGSVHVDFNLPLILFYGQIMQGKTTILNAVRWAFGGSFPSDIITHGKDAGSIRLDFEDGHILREFYRAVGGGEVKARPLTLVVNGARVARPVDKLKNLLNPFLLDQEHLTKMTELERKKYFAELFHTSTEALDAEFATCNTAAAELRSKIKGYGSIELCEVLPVEVSALRTQLQTVKDGNRRATDDYAFRCAGVQAANATRLQNREGVNEWMTEISALKAKLAEAEKEYAAGLQWLNDNPIQTEPAAPQATDTTALEDQISNAAANNVRAEQYQKDKARHEQKLADEKKLLELERRQRAIRDEKISALDKIADESGIPSLEFTEDGGFLYEETTPGMLSTAQLMSLSARLSARLSALYPEGIGLDLIDRGESLGKSIFEYVDRAKAQNVTILATVVGERPAQVPAEVGVFVVENGKVIS